MKRLLLLVVWVLVSTVTVQAETIKVMTYNIANKALTEPENTNGNTAPWSYRKSGVFEIISLASPDVLALQEDSTDQKNDISAYFSSKYTPIEFSANFTVSTDDWNIPQTWSHGTIYYDHSKFDYLAKGEYTTLFVRHGRWAKLKSKKDETEFYIYNIHWYGSSDDSAQQSSAENTANDIWSRVGSSPVILVGDFNAFLTWKSINYLLGDKNTYGDMSYHSNHQKLLNGSTSGGTYHYIYDTYTNTSNVASIGGIDHIFTSSNTGGAHSYNKYQRYMDSIPSNLCIYCTASDHFAAMASVKISQDTNLVPILFFLLDDEES